MLYLALTNDEATLWTIALGIGAVVVLVVIALLTLLYRFVVEVDEGVTGIWETAKRVAENTTTVWQIGATATTAERLRQEAMLHDQLLGEI